jgi:uncharacterized protein
MAAAPRRARLHYRPTPAWWGLRSNAKGTAAAFPVVVFGGEHADVPLSAHSGQAIAEIIGTTDTSAVLDTRLMTVGERTRFFMDFGETLLRTNKGPLHLIIDEAHLFAPQGRVSDPQSGKMLHAANNLVSLGRGIGLRIIMITQRPAKLHKDSLTQAETLIALRLIAPQDRRAVEDWIGEWAEPKQGAKLVASLPSLPTGTGWIWAPELGVLDQVTFPRISTYDSGRAPDGGHGKIVLASIDVPAIEKRLETVAKDVVENDPKRLRARIAELERSGGSALPAAISNAKDDGYRRGKIDGYREGIAALSGVCSRLKDVAASVRKIADEIPDSASTPPGMTTPEKAVHINHPRPLPSPKPVATHRVEAITNPQKRILNAMALLETLGIADLYKVQIAAIAGVSPNSGSFANNLGHVRTSGLIDYPAPGQVAMTAGGKHLAEYPGAPPSLTDLHAAWLRLVRGPQARILKTVIDAYPGQFSKNDLAQAIGVSPMSGSYANNLGRLRTLGVIDYPERGFVRADDVLFPDIPTKKAARARA